MSTFGRYTLVRRVGTGGMAEIWKAKAQGPQGFEKILAIKKVLPHLAEDGDFIDMFVAEAKLVALLVHPNIVQVFDFGQVGKTDYFIAMEYVAGSNLAQVIRRFAEHKVRMPLEVALYITLEACKGLGYAHRKTDAAGNPQHIVHRDVSPQNILVSFEGDVKVTDFGIAKVASALSRTAEGHVRGKLAYMSPEQAHTKSLDNRSDLFSLGIVLYELIAGRRLFGGSSSSQIYSKVTTFEVPPTEALAGMPEEVRAIVGMALKANPDERYSDALEMEAALMQTLRPEGIAQARQALASIVRRLFEEERRLEVETDTAAAIPENPSLAPTHWLSQGPATLILGGGIQEVEPSPPARQREKERETERATERPTEKERADPAIASGLTLARPPGGASVVRVLAEPDEKRASGPPGTSAGTFAAISAAVLLLVVTAFAGGRYFGREAASAPADVNTTPVVAAGTPRPWSSRQPSPDPLATAVAVFAPLPVRTHAPPVRTAPVPTPAQVRSAPTQSGMLSVNAKPWVQVFVDGKLVASETPLRRFSLPVGKHVVRFANPGLKFATEATIDVSASVERSYFVDVKAGSVRADSAQNR